VLEAGTALRASTIEERADWLARAATALSLEARDRSDALAEATGLSIPMVQWAVRTTLGTIVEDAMLALGKEARGGRDETPDPIAMLSVVLAGNVFTASARGIVVPLLFGVPVLVKASSRETLFPAMFRDALCRIDPRLGTSMNVVAFAGGDLECEAALIESAEAVSVYGSDETVAAMAARLEETPLIAHGHGASVAYCSAEALDDQRIGDTIAGLSLDICAYDQRGCLSPQVPARPPPGVGRRCSGTVEGNCRGGREPGSRRHLRGVDSRCPSDPVEPRLSKHNARPRAWARRRPASDRTDRLEPKVHRCRFCILRGNSSAAFEEPHPRCIRMCPWRDANPTAQCASRRPPDLARPLSSLEC
jgi:hypothetical protein